VSIGEPRREPRTFERRERTVRARAIEQRDRHDRNAGACSRAAV
jgi:hypothetical protein